MAKEHKEKRLPKWLETARGHWNFKGRKRPDFAVVPKPGQRSVWDFPRPPIIELVKKPVKVLFNDSILAQSVRCLSVLETASPPTYYIPSEDVRLEKLVAMPAKNSFCEWKGNAAYWALRSRPNHPVAWSYDKPFPEFADIKDHLAFYPQDLTCLVGDDKAVPQASSFYAGWITPDLTGPFKGEKGSEHW